MPRRPFLTEAERADWAAFARHVRPLPGRTQARPEAQTDLQAAPEVKTAETTNHSVRRVAPGRSVLPPLAIGSQPPGVDNASWQRLRTGKLRPSRSLDLHGRTAQRAHIALEHFVQAAYAEHLRCIEVITGLGRGEGGVIRRELPLWLNLPSLRPLVLAAIHPHPANPGAVRLLLRRSAPR